MCCFSHHESAGNPMLTIWKVLQEAGYIQKLQTWYILFSPKYLFVVVQVQLSPFFPHCSPPPPTLNPTFLGFCPWVLYTCSRMALPFLSPVNTPPLLFLLVGFLFQCLWLYFACLFVLLIRFHLKVRSYGICLSLPGLFHLT